MTRNLELVKVKCEKCAGTGTCVDCHGKKKSNIGILGEVEVQCASCHGSGKCLNCRGSGETWVKDNNPLW